MYNIINSTYPEFEHFIVTTLREKSFRAQQVWQWIWQKNVTDFYAMTNISTATQKLLAQTATIKLPEIVTIQTSKDTTKKFLLRLEDGALIETVIIPSTNRNGKLRLAQCLSSQVGCPMKCTFCSTGTMGFTRNMTTGEILGQLLLAKQHLNDSKPEKPILRNLVFMGMGEPLLNIKELTRALQVLHTNPGPNFSSRRITVSTCGIKKGLQSFGENGLAFLALSLHAPNQTLRKTIMPKAAEWELTDLMHELMSYPLKSREKITFEYLLLGGINDSPEHAKELATLLARIKGKKLNLIPYNPSQGQPYSAPKEETVRAFEHILYKKGITTIIRKSKGQDIDAACGQLLARS